MKTNQQKYVKPELVSLGSAFDQVKGVEKGQVFIDHIPPHPLDATVAAYEVDE
jgi:hypothetical protein